MRHKSHLNLLKIDPSDATSFWFISHLASNRKLYQNGISFANCGILLAAMSFFRLTFEKTVNWNNNN